MEQKSWQVSAWGKNTLDTKNQLAITSDLWWLFNCPTFCISWWADSYTHATFTKCFIYEVLPTSLLHSLFSCLVPVSSLSPSSSSTERKILFFASWTRPLSFLLTGLYLSRVAQIWGKAEKRGSRHWCSKASASKRDGHSLLIASSADLQSSFLRPLLSSMISTRVRLVGSHVNSTSWLHP